MAEIRTRPFMPPSRSDLHRTGQAALMRSIVARLRALVEGGNPAQYVEPADREAAWLITKSAVNTATTANTPALLQTVVAGFVASLNPAYASAALLAQTLQLTFDGNNAISVPGFVADASRAAFVKERDPIPVHSRLVTPSLLEPHKVATISMLTVEMVTGSNAQALIENILKQDVGLAREVALFDANPAVVETRPAGLRHDIGALPASPITDPPNPTAAMMADVSKVLGAVSVVAGNVLPVLIAAPARASMLRLFGPRSIQSTVLASSAVADTDLIAIAPNAIASASGSVPEIEVSDETLLHMDTVPADIGTPGAPATVATPTASTYQSGAIAMKCRMLAAWQRRDDRAVAWLSTTAW